MVLGAVGGVALTVVSLCSEYTANVSFDEGHFFGGVLASNRNNDRVKISGVVSPPPKVIVVKSGLKVEFGGDSCFFQSITNIVLNFIDINGFASFNVVYSTGAAGRSSRAVRVMEARTERSMLLVIFVISCCRRGSAVSLPTKE